MLILFCIVPSIPTIIHEECSTVNNSVTVAWQALNPLSNDGYVLELDDGSGGEFRVCWKKKYSRFLLFVCSIPSHFFYCAHFDKFLCTCISHSLSLSQIKKQFSCVWFIILFFISFFHAIYRKCIAEKKPFVRSTVCISIQRIMHALKHSIAFAKENILKRLAYRQLRVSFLTQSHFELQKFPLYQMKHCYKRDDWNTQAPTSHIQKHFFLIFRNSRMVHIRSGAEQRKRQWFSILKWLVNRFGWWLGSLCCVGFSWIFSWYSLLGIYNQ